MIIIYPNQYKVKGRHKDTGRIRTIEVNAVSLTKCNMIADGNGLQVPYEILELPPKMPTERQIAYAKDLDITVPEDATFYDISDLINRVVEDDHDDPNPGIVEYANAREMPFSKYIGEKALFNLIFSTLSGEEKIAFFIFCIYRWMSDDREGNLDTHKYKERFYSMANELEGNKQFEKSMNKYHGKDIRFFGQRRNQDGWTFSGGSTETIAYRNAYDIICKEFGFKNM